MSRSDMGRRRGWLWALGIAAFASVGIYLFVEEVAPPDEVLLAALGIGALFVYLGYSGQLLTALKAGGVEATLAQVVNVVEREAPQPLKAEVGRIVRFGQAAPETKRAAENLTADHKAAKEFEANVEKALNREVKKQGKKWTVDPEPSGSPFDFTVTDQDRRQARVECRWSETPDPYLFDLWVAMAEHAEEKRLNEGVVLVVTEKPPDVKQDRPSGVVVLSDPGNSGQQSRLVAAIEAALR